jgi:hypothetical protein
LAVREIIYRYGITLGPSDKRKEERRRTEAKDVLEKIIEFFTKYEKEMFTVERELVLTEPDANESMNQTVFGLRRRGSLERIIVAVSPFVQVL